MVCYLSFVKILNSLKITDIRPIFYAFRMTGVSSRVCRFDAPNKELTSPHSLCKLTEIFYLYPLIYPSFSVSSSLISSLFSALYFSSASLALSIDWRTISCLVDSFKSAKTDFNSSSLNP